MFDISTVFFASVTFGAFSGGSVTKERQKKLFFSFWGKPCVGIGPQGQLSAYAYSRASKVVPERGGGILLIGLGKNERHKTAARINGPRT